MIRLGSFDSGVAQGDRDAYEKRVQAMTRVPPAEVADGSDKLSFEEVVPSAQEPMTVAALQQGLGAAGFFPGAKVDGICGYRTRSALRLFQEYVRAVERRPSAPDGLFGPSSQQHLHRWLGEGLATEWTPTIERWKSGTLGDTEYTQWLSLLTRLKEKYAGAPNRMLQLVQRFTPATDTRRVADWDFDPAAIHLIAIRRHEASNKFDDIFVVLIKGLVFKFQGSTEPGATTNPLGLPFLAQGQHDYHFGWHKKQYLALRPVHLDRGVLVVRSRDAGRPDDADLNNGLEANATINVHWGGKGVKFDVKTWSEGCQVINGTAYMDPHNVLIDCSSFAATNNAEVAGNPAKTRGAYNMLVDLVTALGSDLPSDTVRYTLLIEADLDENPSVKQVMADARAKAAQFLG